MDALLSLPLLSYLVIPSFGSYSTSLNILFFYMTWSTLVLSYKPIQVELVGTFFVRMIFYVLPTVGFLLFDALLPSVSAMIKAQGDASLPSRTPGLTRAIKMIGVAIVNVLLGLALQAGVELLLSATLGWKSGLKVTTTLPSPWKLAKHLLSGVVLREVLHYYIHRFVLHGPGQLAKLHGGWHHTNKVSHAFVAHYDHPLAWIAWRWIPTYLPAVLLRFHLLTYFVFLAIVSYEECITNSGYSIIPSRFWMNIARQQDVHLRSGGNGNYAAWIVLDWVHGTSLGGDVGQDSSKELDEGEKPANAVLRSAKSSVKSKRKGKSS